MRLTERVELGMSVYPRFWLTRVSVKARVEGMQIKLSKIQVRLLWVGAMVGLVAILYALGSFYFVWIREYASADVHDCVQSGMSQ